MPSTAGISACEIATPTGAPIASAPYVAMPFHEITRALCAVPTRPIPHRIAPVPTRLSPTPSTSRLATSSPMLAAGQRANANADSKSAPLAPHAASPRSTVRFGPSVSAQRPASGRDASVAKYWTLIAAPATIAEKPSSS